MFSIRYFHPSAGVPRLALTNFAIGMGESRAGDGGIETGIFGTLLSYGLEFKSAEIKMESDRNGNRKFCG